LWPNLAGGASLTLRPAHAVDGQDASVAQFDFERAAFSQCGLHRGQSVTPVRAVLSGNACLAFRSDNNADADNRAVAHRLDQNAIRVDQRFPDTATFGTVFACMALRTRRTLGAGVAGGPRFALHPDFAARTIFAALAARAYFTLRTSDPCDADLAAFTSGTGRASRPRNRRALFDRLQARHNLLYRIAKRADFRPYRFKH
jgi:hypothetical protein